MDETTVQIWANRLWERDKERIIALTDSDLESYVADEIGFMDPLHSDVMWVVAFLRRKWRDMRPPADSGKARARASIHRH